MPKISIDYSNCCIYKIEHIENESLIYVGHTTNFKQRKADHKKFLIMKVIRNLILNYIQ